MNHDIMSLFIGLILIWGVKVTLNFLASPMMAHDKFTCSHVLLVVPHSFSLYFTYILVNTHSVQANLSHHLHNDVLHC